MNKENELSTVMQLSNVGDQYISFTADSYESRVALYNAINTPRHRVKEYINTPINLRDVIVMRVEIRENEEQSGGESELRYRSAYRVILIDTDGESYHAISSGIYQSVKTLQAVFGTLHFDEGIKVVVRQKTENNRNLLMLELA